jgi:hypothetical protein
MTPSIIGLPDMLPGQKHIFESMVVSNKFDDEGTEYLVSYTPYVHEGSGGQTFTRSSEKSSAESCGEI